jgi:hypothetical protein
MRIKEVNKLPSAPKKISEEDPSQSLENRMAGVMENIARGVLLFVIVYCLTMIPQLMEILEFMQMKNISVSFTEYLWIVPGALSSHLVYKLSTTVFIRFFFPILSKESCRAGESEAQRHTRLGNYIYGTLYYTFSFFTLFYMTFKSHYCPVAFGGTLQTTDKRIAWPYDVSYDIRIFYMITLGHHVERIIHELVYNSKTKTFYVMLLHHTLTIKLVFLSFFMRHLVFGIPVLLTHDFNDIFLNASRFFRETRYKSFASFLFVLLMVSWFYSRIYSFMVEVIFGVYYQTVYEAEFINKYLYTHLFYGPALSLLYILNVYWGFQILKVAFIRLYKGKESLPFEDSKKKE